MKEIGWHTIMEIEWHSIQEITWHKMVEIRHACQASPEEVQQITQYDVLKLIPEFLFKNQEILFTDVKSKVFKGEEFKTPCGDVAP